MRFQPNRPIETTSSSVVVDAGLPPGRHRFQLVVVSDDGRRSRPADVVVTVTGTPPDRGGAGRPPAPARERS
jgi:hypothetical protein